jgi:S1-C subfamily serine protease
MNYTVVLGDGSEYPAKILNLDKFDDIALLQISASNLTPATLGDSDTLETGESVFAIGNSLGKYSYTVTRGVVSGLGRSVDVSEDADRLHNLIQTDASINPGNSGGPLINLAGQVVGMNTLIDTEGSGLGFAIPINTIKDAEMQLKTFGKVSRPFLGVMFLNIDPATQITQNLTVENGALITSVKSGTPADLAGLQANDIIVGVNDTVLNQSNSLDDVIGKFSAGSQITLKILRNGQEMDVPVVLGELQ